MRLCDIFNRKRWFTVHGVLCFDNYRKREGEDDTPSSVSLYARSWQDAVQKVQKGYYREGFVIATRWFEPTLVVNHSQKQTTTLPRSYKYYV